MSIFKIFMKIIQPVHASESGHLPLVNVNLPIS